MPLNIRVEWLRGATLVSLSVLSLAISERLVPAVGGAVDGVLALGLELSAAAFAEEPPADEGADLAELVDGLGVAALPRCHPRECTGGNG